MDIEIRGAKEHNLKNLSLDIPRNKITVITGLSGSGKSSLAFDTIYAEGQRRYIESLSVYARQFLEQLKKPKVDVIRGLSPAIAIDQKSVATNPRSTVGTVTEIYDYLRLLFAKVGTPMCPEHGLPMTATHPDQMVAEILKTPSTARVYILAPMAQSKKGEFMAEFQKWFRRGFVKAKIDGQFLELEKAKKLAKTKTHDIDLVIDQLVINEGVAQRLSASVHTALTLTDGKLVVETASGERRNFSLQSSCPKCSRSFPELEPRLFSFNNPRGYCEGCHGLGTQDLIEEESLNFGEEGRSEKNVKYIQKNKPKAKQDEDDELDDEPVLTQCESCGGTRLRPEALSVKIADLNISQVSDQSLGELRIWIPKLRFEGPDSLIANKITQQILRKLDYLIRVGTGYLSSNRPSSTLSGGEAQRLRLATQVGSGLIGVTYVMDEPSIGLHPKDHRKMLEIIGELRDRGNTIILVEHDEETIRGADLIYDLGPRAGVKGGEILAKGTLTEICQNPKSITGQFLSGARKIPVPSSRRIGHKSKIEVLGAKGHNLKNVDLRLPLGTLTVVTGVSGSGKSTLIIDTLYRSLAKKIYESRVEPSPYKDLRGSELIDKIIDINQKPIGRTPRSTPATYVGLLSLIRDLYASMPESKMRGYKPGRFSFNMGDGRCEACKGHGQIRLEMNFLADVFVECETCNGKRFNNETLLVKFNGKSIAEVLDLSVEEALEFFKHHMLIRRKLDTLHRVGLDYMTLGQSSTTLSGGEAQRVKLSKELSKRSTGRTLYILDEPTTGLHFEDISKLVELLQELVDLGNTVVVIEHNLDVIKCADHIVDLGPEGGNKGGYILCEGPPEAIVKNKSSVIGPFLEPYLSP